MFLLLHQSLRRLQPFRGQIEQVIGNILGSDTPFTSPLMEEREVKKITILVFGSDDGLCGAYNVNIFKLLVTRVNELREKFGKNIAVEILPIGKKMQKAVSRIAAGNITLRTIDGIDSKTTGLGVKKFVDLLRDAFVAGDTDRVDYLYMNFRSVSRQRPVFGQFLPVTTQAFYAEGVRPSNRPYIFEPDAASIFNAALPMLLLAVMQDIFTENRASEQAARVMAMQSANDNATKLLEQLQLEYNKLRQQSITTELLDILGGQVK